MMPNKSMLKQMQQRLTRIQEELANEMVTGSAGGGAVSVTANGQQLLTAVQLDPEAVDPEDVEMLQDLILTAANDALNQSRELAAKRLGALTGGMGLPGF